MIADLFETHDGNMILHTFQLRKGESIPRAHSHTYPHDAFIVVGKVAVRIGTIEHIVDAPSTVHFPAGAEHTFKAESNEAIIICTHDKRLF